jgi:1A family penicillin-binding protein
MKKRKMAYKSVGFHTRFHRGTLALCKALKRHVKLLRKQLKKMSKSNLEPYKALFRITAKKYNPVKALFMKDFDTVRNLMLMDIDVVVMKYAVKRIKVWKRKNRKKIAAFDKTRIQILQNIDTYYQSIKSYQFSLVFITPKKSKKRAKKKLTNRSFSYTPLSIKSIRKNYRLWHRHACKKAYLTGKTLRGIFVKEKKSSKKTVKKSYAYVFARQNKRLGYVFLGVTALYFIFFYALIIRNLPNPNHLKNGKIPLTTTIYDRNGKVLYRVYKDANRYKLSWQDIPQLVKDSTLAIEDANFYHHSGISPKAMLRAFLHNLRQNNVQLYQGGSTITQQLVKNRLLTSQRTYERKLKEAFLSIWAEVIYSKEDILTMYLNEVGYGGPAYGIEAAAQMYFGTHAKDLNLAQAAFLAGLPAAPTTFSPFGNNPELSYSRQKQVLARMLDLKLIDKEQYENAINEKLTFAPQKIDIKAPHFVMYVRDQLVNHFGEEIATQGGLDVYTTLDLDIQEKAEKIVSKNMSTLGKAYRIGNAASIVTDPKTGEILAMVGSVDYFDVQNSGHVNVVNMPRQPGSALKPVVYGYAFDHGYTPTNVILDAPVSYKSGTEIYKPVNYDGKFHGNVTLRSALANSYNIPAVKLLSNFGVEKMVEQAVKMGINSWLNPPKAGLSLALGGSEITMLDMTRAYQTIANYGVQKEVKAIKEIRENSGKVITDAFYDKSKSVASVINKVQAEENPRALSEIASWWLIDILSDNVARLPAFGNYSKLSVPGHKIAVKTGTSNSFRDNWTVGFSPDYLVATWVGNNDGSYMNRNLVSGITGAAPIWNEIMTMLLEGKEAKEFPQPEGLVPVKICATNGLLTCPNCPQEKIEFFAPDKIPTKACSFRPAGECAEALKQSEGKSDEEKKAMLAGCANVPQ